MVVKHKVFNRVRKLETEYKDLNERLSFVLRFMGLQRVGHD